MCGMKAPALSLRLTRPLEVHILHDDDALLYSINMWCDDCISDNICANVCV